MPKIDKKGLRARLDDIYRWSVKSGVAVATPNSLRVQWDKVIEELNETLLHVYFDDRDKLVDDIGDVFIAFINLLNINPKKKKGVFEQNVKRMDRVASLVKRVSLEYTVSGKSYAVCNIFQTLREAHKLKKKVSEDELYGFLGSLCSVYEIVAKTFNLKTSLRNCIYWSYCEIQGRQYEIRVR